MLTGVVGRSPDYWCSTSGPPIRTRSIRTMFYREILPSMRAKGKLVIVLSHDERYFHLGDRVLWLERGERAGVASAAIVCRNRRNCARAAEGRS